MRLVLMMTAYAGVIAVQAPGGPPMELPAAATVQLSRSLEAAAAHPTHVWRDTPPVNEDGSVNVYIEIPLGDRRKWEFDMRRQARAIDRVVPQALGGYPVNYGFVPQTVSYDGDPFDALVLGSPLRGAEVVRGRIVGLMLMEDEKGPDSKVVITLRGRTGGSTGIPDADRQRIGDYFERYKRHEPGKFSKVHGWGSAADGLSYVRVTHAFFSDCREPAGDSCRVKRAAQLRSWPTSCLGDPDPACPRSP